MTTTDLCFMPAHETARLIARKALSPAELVDAVLAQIDRVQPVLNAFTVVRAEKARAEARAATDAMKPGAVLGPLHGVPFSVKDMVNVAGERITFGSNMFADNVPARDSVVVARLRAAGAIPIGITNMAEVGHKGTNDNPLWGLTLNPWNHAFSTGGSSGGAGAALASGCGALALGTDRAGSVRIPASACGVVGLKTTTGAFPYPELPDLLDTTTIVGPMTRTVTDAALMMTVCAGPDRTDPWSRGAPIRDYRSFARPQGSLAGMRLAWAPMVGNAALDSEVRAACEGAVKALERLGAAVEEIAIDLSAAVDILFVLVSAHAFAAYGGRIDRFADKIDRSLLQGIERGAHYTARDLQNAMLGKTVLFRQIEGVLARFDAIVTPTLAVPSIPSRLRAWEPITINGHATDVPRRSWFPYTHPFNHTGHPAISLPCGMSRDNVPIGLQIAGAWHGEDRLLRIAAEFEAARPWAERRPML
ncbi:MAG: amidase [Alphaproteobacteria bacterium]|nr:amidase [Alphaproteobacteria bacterium]